MKNIFAQGSFSGFPRLHAMRRVARDMDKLLAFIARQPWGDPASRKKDIYRGIDQIVAHPRRNRVWIRRNATGIDLRRHNIAQFAIIYAYVPPNADRPRGIVSIRAIRHRRVDNVFTGVREPHAPYRRPPTTLPAA